MAALNLDNAKIDTNVPMKGNRGGEAKLKSLKIGHSIAVETDDPADDKAKRNYVYSLARKAGIEITIEKEGDGFRFWRTA
jgi:hypothetical protein